MSRSRRCRPERALDEANKFLRDASALQHHGLGNVRFHIPKWVLVAGTSCGKSSVMELLTQVPFSHVDQNMATTRPLLAHMMYDHRYRSPQIFLQDPKTTPGITPVRFATLREHILGVNQGHEVSVEITEVWFVGSMYSPMDVLDLPGTVAGEGEDREQINDLIATTLQQPNTIALLLRKLSSPVQSFWENIDTGLINLLQPLFSKGRAAVLFTMGDLVLKDTHVSVEDCKAKYCERFTCRELEDDTQPLFVISPPVQRSSGDSNIQHQTGTNSVTLEGETERVHEAFMNAIRDSEDMWRSQFDEKGLAGWHSNLVQRGQLGTENLRKFMGKKFREAWIETLDDCRERVEAVLLALISPDTDDTAYIQCRRMFVNAWNSGFQEMAHLELYGKAGRMDRNLDPADAQEDEDTSEVEENMLRPSSLRVSRSIQNLKEQLNQEINNFKEQLEEFGRYPYPVCKAEYENVQDLFSTTHEVAVMLTTTRLWPSAERPGRREFEGTVNRVTVKSLLLDFRQRVKPIVTSIFEMLCDTQSTAAANREVRKMTKERNITFRELRKHDVEHQNFVSTIKSVIPETFKTCDKEFESYVRASVENLVFGDPDILLQNSYDWSANRGYEDLPDVVFHRCQSVVKQSFSNLEVACQKFFVSKMVDKIKDHINYEATREDGSFISHCFLLADSEDKIRDLRSRGDDILVGFLCRTDDTHHGMQFPNIEFD